MNANLNIDPAPILVTAGTGKTGRRVVQLLNDAGHSVRVGSRSSHPVFDWTDQNSWPSALVGVSGAYIAFTPDLAFPGAVATVQAFCSKAVSFGVKRLVLLSGRGEEEAVAAENVVKAAGVAWTIVRASWFSQNFSEDYLLGPVLSGIIELPARDVTEPFVDADDIADVAVSALTDARHDGQTYDVTGPHLLSFDDVARLLTEATNRHISYVPVTTAQYVERAISNRVPHELAQQLGDLFSKLLDGRNAFIGHGVQQALGREPRQFADYARTAAATGIWHVAHETSR
jgi:uncharacterized protein YbjT (DUF2867 family)